MKILLLLILPFFTFNQVEDPRLRKHVETFILEAQTRGVQLPDIRGLRIQFKIQQLDGAYWPADSLITISTRYKLEPRILELIVFHELGHAWLKRPHDPATSSLMNKKPQVQLLRRHRKDFLDNFFLGTPVFR